jgi:hypothetical protein
MLINQSFGRIIYGETVDVMLIINNTVNCDIKIKDLTIKVTNEVQENYESIFKSYESILWSNNSQPIEIEPYKFFTKRLSITADVICKYMYEF